MEVLENNNCHFPHSFRSITMETAIKPGSLSFDSEYVLNLNKGKMKQS